MLYAGAGYTPLTSFWISIKLFGWQILVQYNTIKAFITRAWSAGGPNLRCRQSLGGRVARRGSKRRHGKNSVLGFLLQEAKDELYIG